MSIPARWTELVDLRRRLDPGWVSPRPIDASTLDQMRHALGFRLPDEVMDAIEHCSGAEEAWSSPEHDSHADSEFDYGDISFLAPDTIVDEYEERKKLAAELDEPGTAFGPVRGVYFDSRWVPFAKDVGGGRFAFDLHPAKGGKSGQVIWFEDEASIVMVVASTFDDFLLYGCDCLLHELGELKEPPQPPFTGAEDRAETPVSEECMKVWSLWEQIRKRAPSAARQPGTSFVCHKPARLEDIEKLEKRLKFALPAQVRCLYQRFNGAQSVWQQRGKYGVYPLGFVHLGDVARLNKALHDMIREGSVEVRGVPRIEPDAVFFALASAGWIEEFMSFYVLAGSASQEGSGQVLVLRDDRESHNRRLEVFYPDVAGFLKAGLEQM